MKEDNAKAAWLQNATTGYQDWRVEVSAAEPGTFILYFRDQPQCLAVLTLNINGRALPLHEIRWQFRRKAHQLEQWCNLTLGDTLSVSMTYRFCGGRLEIDYLARNPIPSRLELGHQIRPSALQSSQSEGEPAVSWVFKRNGQPSEYLIEQTSHGFCEAFSASLWLVLGQNCDENIRT
ncbi:hypothetical protein [Photobacterium halotolerans]|uniref:hypothetical protein n=1 Tax=Photobacterium halotolerans TaxID=265726 RepID=UPI0013728BC2|nr:hypothetical protein [Photobacterium halotolerans]NAW88441.1 hypothetical protein [Photobacterium halotolerans]